MLIQFPFHIVIIFIYLCMLATIGITCVVIDTVLNVKNYFIAKQIRKEKEWGDLIDAKINLGGGI